MYLRFSTLFADAAILCGIVIRKIEGNLTIEIFLPYNV